MSEPKKRQAWLERAYHRALKRGELWATWKQAMRELTNNCMRALYEHDRR